MTNRHNLLQCLDPNIEGGLAHGGIDYAPSATGVFEHDTPLTTTVYYWSGTGGSGKSGFSFKASRDNAIYASDHVQAPALQTLVCIKV